MASLTSLVPCKHYFEHPIGGQGSDTITGKPEKRYKVSYCFLLTLIQEYDTDLENGFANDKYNI